MTSSKGLSYWEEPATATTKPDKPIERPPILTRRRASDASRARVVTISDSDSEPTHTTKSPKKNAEKASCRISVDMDCRPRRISYQNYEHDRHFPSNNPQKNPATNSTPDKLEAVIIKKRKSVLLNHDPASSTTTGTVGRNSRFDDRNGGNHGTSKVAVVIPPKERPLPWTGSRPTLQNTTMVFDDDVNDLDWRPALSSLPKSQNKLNSVLKKHPHLLKSGFAREGSPSGSNSIEIIIPSTYNSTRRSSTGSVGSKRRTSMLDDTRGSTFKRRKALDMTANDEEDEQWRMDATHDSSPQMSNVIVIEDDTSESSSNGMRGTPEQAESLGTAQKTPPPHHGLIEEVDQAGRYENDTQVGETFEQESSRIPSLDESDHQKLSTPPQSIPRVDPVLDGEESRGSDLGSDGAASIGEPCGTVLETSHQPVTMATPPQSDMHELERLLFQQDTSSQADLTQQTPLETEIAPMLDTPQKADMEPQTASSQPEALADENTSGCTQVTLGMDPEDLDTSKGSLKGSLDQMAKSSADLDQVTGSLADQSQATIISYDPENLFPENEPWGQKEKEEAFSSSSSFFATRTAIESQPYQEYHRTELDTLDTETQNEPLQPTSINIHPDDTRAKQQDKVMESTLASDAPNEPTMETDDGTMGAERELVLQQGPEPEDDEEPLLKQEQSDDMILFSSHVEDTLLPPLLPLSSPVEDTILPPPSPVEKTSVEVEPKLSSQPELVEPLELKKEEEEYSGLLVKMKGPGVKRRSRFPLGPIIQQDKGVRPQRSTRTRGATVVAKEVPSSLEKVETVVRGTSAGAPKGMVQNADQKPVQKGKKHVQKEHQKSVQEQVQNPAQNAGKKRGKRVNKVIVLSDDDYEGKAPVKAMERKKGIPKIDGRGRRRKMPIKELKDTSATNIPGPQDSQDSQEETPKVRAKAWTLIDPVPEPIVEQEMEEDVVEVEKRPQQLQQEKEEEQKVEEEEEEEEEEQEEEEEEEEDLEDLLTGPYSALSNGDLSELITHQMLMKLPFKVRNQFYSLLPPVFQEQDRYTQRKNVKPAFFRSCEAWKLALSDWQEALRHGKFTKEYQRKAQERREATAEWGKWKTDAFEEYYGEKALREAERDMPAGSSSKLTLDKMGQLQAILVGDLLRYRHSFRIEPERRSKAMDPVKGGGGSGSGSGFNKTWTPSTRQPSATRTMQPLAPQPSETGSTPEQEEGPRVIHFDKRLRVVEVMRIGALILQIAEKPKMLSTIGEKEMEEESTIYDPEASIFRVDSAADIAMLCLGFDRRMPGNDSPHVQAQIQNQRKKPFPEDWKDIDVIRDGVLVGSLFAIRMDLYNEMELEQSRKEIEVEDAVELMDTS